VLADDPTTDTTLSKLNEPPPVAPELK